MAKQSQIISYTSTTLLLVNQLNVPIYVCKKSIPSIYQILIGHLTNIVAWLIKGPSLHLVGGITHFTLIKIKIKSLINLKPRFGLLTPKGWEEFSMSWFWIGQSTSKPQCSWSNQLTGHVLAHMFIFSWTYYPICSCETIPNLLFCPVGWGYRIHQLLFCSGVIPLQTSVLDMTLNNVMVRFQ